jgi:transcriptional regulator with XRE-family HTH domain
MDNEKRSPVKEIRKALGLTQEEMAAKLECSYASARRFEYEGTLPRQRAVMNNLRKLAKQAGVQLESGGAGSSVSHC